MPKSQSFQSQVTEDFDISDHAYIINLMTESLYSLPPKTFISHRLESGVMIALYKDPKSKIRWQYKMPGGRFSPQKLIDG